MASMGCKIALQQAAAKALAMAFLMPLWSAVVELGVGGGDDGVAFVVVASSERRKDAAIFVHGRPRCRWMAAFGLEATRTVAVVPVSRRRNTTTSLGCIGTAAADAKVWNAIASTNDHLNTGNSIIFV